MIPIELYNFFHRAYIEFFYTVGLNPELQFGPKPLNVDQLGATYIIFSDKYGCIRCEYRLNDKQYNQIEIKRLLANHKRSK